MNAIARLITFVLVAAAAMGINHNSASAQVGYELTCHGDSAQIYNFVTCGSCGGCGSDNSAMLGEAVTSGRVNREAIKELGGQLSRANSALASLRRANSADKALVVGLERRVTELESKVRSSCASITETASAQACWAVLDKATGGTNQSALAVFNNAIQSGVPVDMTVAVGSTALTPGFYGTFKTPDTNPAFANVRRDRIGAASEYDSGNRLWPYLVVPATTTLAGMAIGYGYGDDSRTTTDAAGNSSFREGNKAETTLIGGGIGLASGLVFDGIYYLMTKPDAPAAR